METRWPFPRTESRALHWNCLDLLNGTRFSSLPLLAPSLIPTAFLQISRFPGFLVQEKSCNPRALPRPIRRYVNTACFFLPFHPCENCDSMEQSTPILEKRQTAGNSELPPGTSRELFPPVSFRLTPLTVGTSEWTELDFPSAAVRCSVYAEPEEIHPECALEKAGVGRALVRGEAVLSEEGKEIVPSDSAQPEALFHSATSHTGGPPSRAGRGGFPREWL